MRRDVQADFVEQLERTHGHAPASCRVVDGADRYAFPGHDQRFGQVRHQDAVHEEPRGIADEHGRLPDATGQRHGRRQGCVVALCGAHDFDQGHLGNRVEEVEAHHTLGVERGPRHLRDAERAGVRGQHRGRSRQAIEAREHVVLGVHRFDDRLDHEISQRQTGPVGRRRHAVERVSRAEPVHAPGGHVIVQHALDSAQRRGDRRRVHLDEANGEAGTDQRMDDSRAHRPAADHGGVLHLPGFRVEPLGRALLGALAKEEQPYQVARGLRVAQLHDRATLRFESRGKAPGVSDIDHVQQPQRRGIVAVRQGHRLAPRGGEHAMARGPEPRHGAIDPRRLLATRAAQHDALGRRQERLGSDDLVHQSRPLRLPRRHGLARQKDRQGPAQVRSFAGGASFRPSRE